MSGRMKTMLVPLLEGCIELGPSFDGRHLIEVTLSVVAMVLAGEGRELFRNEGGDTVIEAFFGVHVVKYNVKAKYQFFRSP